MVRILQGKYKNKKLFVNSTNIRPTLSRVRESIFNVIEHRFIFSWAGKTIMDIFAGSGSFGFECLSRGAKKVNFIENNKESLLSLKKNINYFNEDKNVNILFKDAFKYYSCEDTIDLVFMAPPYRLEIHQALLSLYNSRCYHDESIIIIEIERDCKIPSEFNIVVEKTYKNCKVFFLTINK